MFSCPPFSFVLNRSACSTCQLVLSSISELLSVVVGVFICVVSGVDEEVSEISSDIHKIMSWIRWVISLVSAAPSLVLC